MSRGIACLASAIAFLSALAVSAVSATACEGGGGGGKELTTLSTKLSGESKEGEELTVLEGSKVKDKATLSGKNASSATGTVTYKVYSDKECKTLVVNAGEVAVSGESVPASSEEELEGGKTYYWQAHYGGDTKNAESTSACTEVLNVKAKTSLSLKLAGEGSEGEEITISAGSEAEGKATLSGTNSATAGGKAVYNIYSDKECKTFVVGSGEVEVKAGKIPPSSKKVLEGGKTYYWQVTYKGDALHQESKSTCGKAVLHVNALTCTFPYCEPTITPGVKITTNIGNCTAGPIMTKGAEMFLLTAGHCFGNIAAGVNSRYPVKEPAKEREIGKTGSSTNTKMYDLAEIKIENAEWLLKGGAAAPLLVEWQGEGKAGTVASVAGAVAENKLGEERCHTGAVSDEVECGKIVNVSATFAGVEKLVETSMTAEEGDSGGPVYTRSGKAVNIAGVLTSKGDFFENDQGEVKKGEPQIKGITEAKVVCGNIEKMEKNWTVPISGEWIPPNTTIVAKGCKREVGEIATITMSANAENTDKETNFTYGYKHLAAYEPMGQIEALYKGQTLLAAP